MHDPIVTKLRQNPWNRLWAKLDYLLPVKSFGWVGKVLSYCFQYSGKDDNSEFLLPSMVPCVKLKLRVIVFWYQAKRDNSKLELSLPTNSMCHGKIPTYLFSLYIKAITQNSPKFSELLLLHSVI